MAFNVLVDTCVQDTARIAQEPMRVRIYDSLNPLPSIYDAWSGSQSTILLIN